MFLQLGDYSFESIKLPQSWNESTETSYVEIPIINGKPVLQRTGEKLIEHDIIVELRDEFCKPEQDYNALQIYRRNGTILQVTSGNGINFGRYVITTISKTVLRASDNGYVSAMQLAIHLKEYNTTKTTTEQTGAALKNNSPVEEQPLKPLKSLPISLSNDIDTGVIKSSEISNSAKKTSNPNYQKISSLATDAVNAFDSANTKIVQTEKIVYRAVALRNSVTACKDAANAVKVASDIHDYASLMSANDNLEVSVNFLKGAAAPVAAFVGSREGGK